jgi:hypothetical protein
MLRDKITQARAGQGPSPGVSPGMRHEIHLVERHACPRQAMQQLHSIGVLPGWMKEASRLPSSQLRGHLSR